MKRKLLTMVLSLSVVLSVGVISACNFWGEESLENSSVGSSSVSSFVGSSSASLPAESSSASSSENSSVDENGGNWTDEVPLTE